MSRSELTDAYVSGRISRRSFVRGMMALGASVPVAMALADRVTAGWPNTSKLQRNDDDIYADLYERTPLTQASTQPAHDSSTLMAPLAAGAAAAALVAIRMRRQNER